MEERERWLRARAIFEDALDLEPQQRPSFIEQVSAGDEGLRQEVVSMLESHEQDRDFLETPAACLNSESIEAWMAVSAVGKRFGSYLAVATIAQGGMSTVYLGERADREYIQRVCIKLIRPGFESEMIVRRFVAERQILARLEHPNIARLLDGGRTEEGLPYFVMEYVDGVRIDEYCDAQGLGIPERLGLFCKICEAVHYAHQNLVIHRDIKPGNILVDTAGEPKLLDFGIAKLLAPDALGLPAETTLTFLRAMTPQYASPEQVRGGVISTVSDIYSLGVLLYELLAGRRPYDAPSLTPETMRAVCEADPEKPSTAVAREGEDTNRRGETIALTPQILALCRGSTPGKLRRALAGDLDNIVLKAMRKEPERRYASAEQLAEDLRFHLDGLPVRAREDTLWYRTAKFAARNKAGIAAAGLVALALALGIASTAWQAAVAQHRFDQVRGLASSLIFKLEPMLAKDAGATAARRVLVSEALTYLDALAKDAQDDRSLQVEVASAYERLGEVQGHPAYSNLGDVEGALTSYRRALAIRRRLSATMIADKRLRDDELAGCLKGLGRVLELTNRNREVLAVYREALAIRQARSEAEPSNPILLEKLLRTHDGIGRVLLGTGDLSGAAEHFGRTLALAQRYVQLDPLGTKPVLNLWYAYRDLGRLASEHGDPAGALAHYTSGLELMEKLVLREPKNTRFQSYLAIAHQNIADSQGNPEFPNLKDWQGALSHYRKTLDIDARLAKADPDDVEAQRELSIVRERIGEVLAGQGRIDEALAHYAAGLKIRLKLAGIDRTNTGARADLAYSYYNIGSARLLAGDTGGALVNLKRALSIRKDVLDSGSANAETRRQFVRTLSKLREASEMHGPADVHRPTHPTTTRKEQSS